jgi:hypothetical protein
VRVLALAMMIFGGQLLLWGASMLRGLPGPPAGGAEPALGQLGTVFAALALAHPVAVKVNALSKLALALLLLYAVAAVFTSDARARASVLLAAWAGIAYQIGDGLFLFLVVRPRSVSELVSLADVFIVATGLVGVAFSVLLLAFFGGRRGRVFFGPGQEPRHGHGG